VLIATLRQSDCTCTVCRCRRVKAKGWLTIDKLIYR
jgi:hypothetical protein